MINPSSHADPVAGRLAPVTGVGADVASRFHQSLSIDLRRRLSRAVATIDHVLTRMDQGEVCVPVDWSADALSLPEATLVNQVLVIVADAHPKSGWTMSNVYRAPLCEAAEASLALNPRRRFLAAADLARDFRISLRSADRPDFRTRIDRITGLAAAMMRTQDIDEIRTSDGLTHVLAIAFNSASAKSRGHIPSGVVVCRVQPGLLRGAATVGSA